MKSNKMPRLNGDDYVGDQDAPVPVYLPAVGQSGDEAVKALGLKPLARRESGNGLVVALVDCGGGVRIRCVK